MPHSSPALVFATALAAFVSPLAAADLFKADNATGLNTAGSYTNAAATPTNADRVIFDSTFAGTTTAILGGGAQIRALRIVDPGHDVTIALGNSTFSIGVNGGASGSIDLSEATKNLTVTSGGSFGAFRMYGAASTITVAAGRTLTVGAPVFVFNTGGGSLTISGAGVVNLNGEVRNGDTGTRTTRVVHTGTGTLTLGGANTYTGGTAVTVGTVAISQDFSMGVSSVNAIGIDAAAGTHGGITFGGTTLTLGGSLLLDVTGAFASGGTFDLIDFGSGAPGGVFSSVSIGGSYSTVLEHDGLGIWSGTTEGLVFAFNQTSGDLVVTAVPEPAGAALVLGVLGLGVASSIRRRR